MKQKFEVKLVHNGRKRLAQVEADTQEAAVVKAVALFVNAGANYTEIKEGKWDARAMRKRRPHDG